MSSIVARKLRIQYPGACYHVVNRGHRGEAIVREDVDREVFLRTLGEACAKTGWRVHAYALLSNHFHLIVETPQPNLVTGMKWFLGTYTARFNRRHSLDGHLFTGRYRSQLLDPSSGGLRAAAATYLHLNPLRCGDVAAVAELHHYRWSSFPAYLQKESRPVWLRVADVFTEMGLEDDDSGRQALDTHTQMEHLRLSPDRLEQFRSGWYLGSEAFRCALLDRLESQRTPNSSGGVWRESDTLQAERLVQHQIETLGWGSQELVSRSKMDPEKMRIARILRRDTTMTIQWIADRLHMGTRNTLRNALAMPPASDVFRKARVLAQSMQRAAVAVRPLVSKEPSAPFLATPQPPSVSQGFSVEPGWD